MAKKYNRLPEPAVKVIGPQLGIPNKSNAIAITIALPHLPHVESLECILFSEDGKEIDREDSSQQDARFHNFLFKFDGLTSNQKYFYKFIDRKNNEIPLEGGLTYQDCWFYGPDFNNETDKFVLLSCNNPFSGKSDKPDFQMWQRLNDQIAARKEIRLLIQGGDQVYHDRIEKASLKRLKKNPTKEVYSLVTEEIIKNYQHFYGDLNYRKILARVPSAAMLDDHDITDGWGGRPESFQEEAFKKTDKFKPEWERFFEFTYSAFKAYQTIKNPPPLHKGVATTYLDIGNNRIFLLDFRKEKNSEKGQLITPAHEEAILNKIKETKHRIFLLSPVVPVRINPSVEKSLGGWSLRMLKLHKFLGKWLNADNKLMKIIGAMGSYTDDIEDGLTSDTNKPYFIRLLSAIKQSHKKNKNECVIISGDIHTGGISEIFIDDGDLIIPQIVSSPIAYKPMQKLVKGVTTTESDQEINDETNSMRIKFRNIFFRSKRNFAIIAPGNIKDVGGVEFHFEDVAEPIRSAAYFS